MIGFITKRHFFSVFRAFGFTLAIRLLFGKQKTFLELFAKGGPTS